MSEMLQDRGGYAVPGQRAGKCGTFGLRSSGWQRAGNCWIFGTSFSGYLLVFGYFCCFLACDHALLQVLRCSQPTPSNSSVLPVLILFEYFGYLAQHLFQCYALPFDFLRVCCTWSVQISQGLWLYCHFLWYMAGSNLSRTLVSSSLSLVPCDEFNAPIPNNDGQSHMAYF